MVTKLVTTFYAAHYDPPFWGKRSRYEWYSYSLISICGLGADIVCYTDDEQDGYNHLLRLKEKHNLTNLTIKKYNLKDSPFHDRIYNIRMNNPELYNNEFHPFYTLPMAIYWLKWHFLNMEYEDGIYLYWIDSGLSTGAIFPYKYNLYSTEPGFYIKYHDREHHHEHAFKEFIFAKILTPEALNKINEYVEDKILCVCRQNVMDNDYRLLETQIQESFSEQVISSNKFPVGAMFGGNTPYLKQYINAFTELAERVLSLPEQNYICTEQELMGYIHVKYPEWFKDWTFTTFYHEELPIWETIKDNPEGVKPLHYLFLDPFSKGYVQNKTIL
jgi:hypothetical protein